MSLTAGSREHCCRCVFEVWRPSFGSLGTAPSFTQGEGSCSVFIVFMPGPAQCVQAARQCGAVCRALFQFCRCSVHGMRPSTILMPATQFSKCICCSGSHVWSHRLSRFWPPFLLMSRGESGNTCVPAAARHLYPRTNRDRLRVASHTRTTAWRLCLHFWKNGFPSRKVCVKRRG